MDLIFKRLLLVILLSSWSVSLFAVRYHGYEKLEIVSGDTVAHFLISRKMPAVYMEKIVDDLNFLASIPCTDQQTSLHNEVFGGPVCGETYLKWLAKGMYKIGFSVKYPQWVAYSHQTHNIFRRKNSPKRRRILLGAAYFPRKSQIERVTTLIHEARHTLRPVHVDCKYGVATCDDSVTGSWGTELIFKYNLRKAFPDYFGEEYKQDEFNMIVGEENILRLRDDMPR